MFAIEPLFTVLINGVFSLWRNSCGNPVTLNITIPTFCLAHYMYYYIIVGKTTQCTVLSVHVWQLPMYLVLSLANLSNVRIANVFAV